MSSELAPHRALSATPAGSPSAPFWVHALDPDALEQVRAGGPDAFGSPAERVVSEGGDPLRCCLRDCEPGADLILFGYAPALPPTAYREAGPVFAHADARDCTGPGDPRAWPRDWLRRAQVLRAYDAAGRIHEATRVHDGHGDPAAALAALLSVPGVAQVHSRNVAWGCYMFAATAGPRRP